MAVKAWLGLVCLASADLECLDECDVNTQFLQFSSVTQLSSHPWPHARGRIPLQDGTTPSAVRVSEKTWSFHDPQGSQHNLLAGGAVIDMNWNLFQMTHKGVYAFNLLGEQIWHYDTPGKSNNQVTLYGDMVLGTTTTGHAFALERLTGQPKWVTKFAENAGHDCGYPAAAEGVFVVGGFEAHRPGGPDGGNRKAMALDVHTGQALWDYETDQPIWNFAPLYVGDGTIVFMDLAGGAYRLNLTTGLPLWRNLPADSRWSFSDGGAGLGPNDIVYTCSNTGTDFGTEGTPGMVRAFHLSNGTEVWHHMTEFPCNTYPSIGKLAGVTPLAVVVAPGSFMPGVNLSGSILALDALTGQELWNVPLPAYRGFVAAGDDVVSATLRLSEHMQPICFPAHWSSPLIDGVGHVYVGRQDGKLHKITGMENGQLLRNYTDLGEAFLHGALSAAPGVFAVSTCETLHVYLQ